VAVVSLGTIDGNPGDQEASRPGPRGGDSAAQPPLTHTLFKFRIRCIMSTFATGSARKTGRSCLGPIPPKRRPIDRLLPSVAELGPLSALWADRSGYPSAHRLRSVAVSSSIPIPGRRVHRFATAGVEHRGASGRGPVWLWLRPSTASQATDPLALVRLRTHAFGSRDASRPRPRATRERTKHVSPTTERNERCSLQHHAHARAWEAPQRTRVVSRYE
jgi:hypothetical protein